MIQSSNLIKKFNNKSSIDFQDIYLSSHDILLITGPSGSGKTTLLKILSGLDNDYSGRYTNTIPENKIGYFFHDYRLIPELNIVENIMLGNREKLPENINIQSYTQKIHDLARLLGVESLMHSDICDLSSGEYQRMCLIRAFIGDKDLIILDEPTSHLDSESTTLVLDQIVNRSESGAIICISTHDNTISELLDAKLNKSNIIHMNF